MGSLLLKSWRPGRVLVVLVLIGAAVVTVTQFAIAQKPTLWTDGAPFAPVAPTPWVTVAKTDTPAVVNISTAQVVKNPFRGGSPFGDEFFGQFFGELPKNFKRESLGSGFIIRADGLIVTNNHVVENATEITVKLADGRRFPGKVVGRDAKTDLALLKVSASNLPVLALGDSDRLQIGEPVAAIGNPFGLEGTITTGIVSAKGRVIGEGPYDSFIQTDASINPGNSGGPLVNMAGQVIGVNTAIYSQSGGSMGIGFAIPINLAKSVLPQVEAKGRVTRGWLGVGIQPITPELAKALHLANDEGALVGQVTAGSPAAKAGVQPGDVIVQYDGHPIRKTSDLPLLVAETPVGKTVRLEVRRDWKPVSLTAQIAELAESAAVATTEPTQDRLGLSVEPLTAALAKRLEIRDHAGVAVRAVADGSPAEQAGIQAGDVIVEANRKPLRSVADLRSVLAASKPGETVLFLIHRKDARVFVAVEVPAAPAG
jgi:serine protease Do